MHIRSGLSERADGICRRDRKPAETARDGTLSDANVCLRKATPASASGCHTTQYLWRRGPLMSGETLQPTKATRMGPTPLFGRSSRRAPHCVGQRIGACSPKPTRLAGERRTGATSTIIHLSLGRWLLVAGDNASNAGSAPQRGCRRRAIAYRSPHGRPRRLCLRR